MGILIDLVRVAGFRGINNLEVSLGQLTVLIGPNNSGKTSLIKAFQLALGDYSRYLTEEDFYIAPDSKRVDEIIIDVRIVSVDAAGKRLSMFEGEWINEFGDKIQSEISGEAFLAIRTRSKRNLTQGGFETVRATLQQWHPFATWTIASNKESKLGTRYQSIPFISTESQRDIYQDLRDRSSFIGKILSAVEYDKADMQALEELIKEVNDEAVGKSQALTNLKSHLGKLNQSISGSGGAELTPLPKKLRDLSKNFSVYFGETDTNSFSMEYHGMGTRSWAAMLTIMSFIELAKQRYKDDSKPFFPILAMEEPEAHLHPNAQKTLYKQLSSIKGQLIISTHSPFLAARADLMQIRSLVKTAAGVAVHQMVEMSNAEKKIIAREVMAKRGELLFAKCVLLAEGITEEQVLPAMLEVYFGASPWELGISCVSVGGTNYKPYVRIANSLGIPACILSDNDIDKNNGKKIKDEVTRLINNLIEEMGVSFRSDIHDKYFLDPGNNFEKELIDYGLRDELIEAFVLDDSNGVKNPQKMEPKYKEFNALSDDEMIIKMRKLKSSYAGFLADVLLENPKNKTVDERIPPNIRACFGRIKEWLV